MSGDVASWHPALMPDSTKDIIPNESDVYEEKHDDKPAVDTKEPTENPIPNATAHDATGETLTETPTLSQEATMATGELIPPAPGHSFNWDDNDEWNLESSEVKSQSKPEDNDNFFQSEADFKLHDQAEVPEYEFEFKPSEAEYEVSPPHHVSTETDHENAQDSTEVENSKPRLFDDPSKSSLFDEPFSSMPQSDRTNSFPPVPPTHHAVEPTLDFGEGDEADESFFAQTSQEPAGTRFEEGVPLIPEQNNFFGEDDGGDDFFNQVPALERKSTTQVLNSMDVEPSTIHETIPEDANEIDLDAKWKEALGDDDFLDDDFLPDDDLPDDLPNDLPDDIPETALDPTAVFGSDDEGFLEDEPEVPSTAKYTPVQEQTQAQPSNPYVPTAPNLTDLNGQYSRPSSSSLPAHPPMYNNVIQQEPRPEVHKATSFADKSKGGYHSPYDLPMEVVKPRKRASQGTTRVNTATPSAPPPGPPKSATISPSPQDANKQTPQLRSKASFFEDLPIASKPKPAGRYTPQPAAQPTPPAAHTFAPPPAQSTPHPAAANTFAPPTQPQIPAQPLPPAQTYPQPTNNYTPAARNALTSSPSLIAPPKVSPYAPLPEAHANSRYSPAPPSQTAPAPSRYSPVSTRNEPPQARTVSAGPLPQQFSHHPRTSSPLAHFQTAQDDSGTVVEKRTGSFTYSLESRGSNLHAGMFPEDGRTMHQNKITAMAGMTKSPPSLTPPQSRQSSMSTSPVRQNEAEPIAPPRRSMTQSPGSLYANKKQLEPLQRPASVQSPASPTYSSAYAPMPGPSYASAVPSDFAPARDLNKNINYAAPTDGRELDPLERWKGCPVFVWGVGGTIATTFPKDIPRYSVGSTQPLILRTPGEVKIRSIKEIFPLEEHITSFPGPLKGKSKKKEVVTWLTNSIEAMSAKHQYGFAGMSHDEKREEERMLLWNILKVFVENDGVLEGNEAVVAAIRSILTPEAEQQPYVSGSQPVTAEAVDPSTISEIKAHLIRGDVDKAVWEAVDKRLWSHALLIAGAVSPGLYQRVAQEFVQKEVRPTGDNESLAALYEILAGNFEESVDELVPPSTRAGFQMVSTASASQSTSNTGSLDKWRETLSLILSNRSTDDIKGLNALGKLLSSYDRVEAAHICFLFARSISPFSGIDDPQSSIVLLGRDHLKQPLDFSPHDAEPILLSEVYEYALSLSASASTPTAPHLAVYKLQHALILAEHGHRDKALQYCDTISSLASSQTRRSPYFNNLLISEVEDLSKRLKSSPKDGNSSWISKPSIDKVSGTFMAKFNKFVAGEENENASGEDSDVGPFAKIAGGTPTISRSPSIADMYGAHNGSTAPISTPVNGYPAGLGLNGTMPIPTTRSASRYAPNNQNLDVSSSYGSQRAVSYEQRSSDSYKPYEPRRSLDQPGYTPKVSEYPSPTTTSPYTPDTSHPSTGQFARSYTPPNTQPAPTYGSPQSVKAAGSGRYEPTPAPAFNAYEPSASVPSYQPSSYEPSAPEPSYQPSSYERPAPESSYQPSSYEPLAPEPSQHNSYEPAPEAHGQHNSYEPLNEHHEPTVEAHSGPNSFEAPTASPAYEASTGYEPPSSGYVPYQPDDDEDIVETKPKKKSFMDDDDDIPALKAPEKSKAEKDREADEAFRKAAEADAKRDAEEAAAKKGWGFGGWFSRKPSSTEPQPNKPIRAKLGEQSSFVYDPELKRWVNKKAGTDGTPSPTATPPPPKGPPKTPGSASLSRAATPMTPDVPMQRTASGSSTASGPPGGPPSGLSSGPGLPMPEKPSTAPPMMRAASNGSAAPPAPPPSRPSTGMSNASSIDDLLGPASTGSRRGPKKPRKGRGYIDVMGDK